MQYAVENKTERKFIGDCTINLDQDDSRLGAISITISPHELKNGYAKEALIAILNFLFNIESYHRFTETADAVNIASVQLLKGPGLRQ